VQMDRLVKLGAWLQQNGDAIYGTRPWTRAEGKTADGMSIRFTTKGTKLYAILLGKPDASSVLLKDVSAKSGTTIHLLGVTAPLTWKPEGNDLNITLPTTMPGNYAWALEIKSPS
jgi:alpha-L-fucosidase